MATRRIKRIKRSKKQVHRARDRKTNRRRRRHTRRQMGGAIITVCTKTGHDFFGTAKGIDITYDTESHVFTIGTQKTFSDLTTFNGKQRYERAVSALKLLHEEKPRVTIGWYDFALFAKMYCDQNPDPQCANLSDFINLHRKDSDKDKQQPSGINEIKMSIKAGEEAFDKYSTYRIANPNPGAGAAAPAPTCQDHVNGKGTPNSIILTQDPSCIAYVNHTNIYEMQSLSRKQPKYSFKKFTIKLMDDSVIVGKLELDFSKGANPVSFTLELNLGDSQTPAFVRCMSADDLTYGIVTVQNVTMERSKLKVIGNVTAQKTRDGEMYNFQGFVRNFAEKYEVCTKGIGQKLENAEQLNSSDARALVKEIDMRIGVLTKKMQENAQYAGLNQLYLELKKQYPKQIVDTPQNLETLNKINDGMKALLSGPPDMATTMGQLTFEQPTGDDLAARLAAVLKDS